MPNWCETTYVVTGNKESIDTLHRTLKQLDSSDKELEKSDFGKLWLGNIVVAFKGDWNKVYCRGHVTYYEMDGDNLKICTETAWQEMSEFRHFLETTLPETKIYYLEEESGCEVYNTNDATGTYFPCRYFIDSYDNPEYFNTFEEARKYASKIVGYEIEATSEAVINALDKYVEEHEDEDLFYSFHGFTVCND